MKKVVAALAPSVLIFYSFANFWLLKAVLKKVFAFFVQFFQFLIIFARF